MNKEELLRPRYKVIADYPKSIFKVGEILHVGSMGDLLYCDTNGPRMSQYPHLFKPLQWWEDRKPEDMPEYVKFKHYPNGENDFSIVKVDGVFVMHDFTSIGYFGIKYKNGGGNIYTSFTPASEQEYLDYLTQQNKKA